MRAAVKARGGQLDATHWLRQQQGEKLIPGERRADEAVMHRDEICLSN